MPITLPLKRDNHYVPSLYLKQWANSGKVYTYRLLVAHERVPLWKRFSLKGIAYHQNLYTYVGAQGETDEFETWLDQAFEAPAEPAIARAILGARLSADDWQALARFVAAQDVRTPRRLQEFLTRQSRELPALMERTIKHAVKKLVEREVLPLPSQAAIPPAWPQELFQVKIGDRGDGTATLATETVIGRRMWLASCRLMLTNTIEHLLRHRWTIWRAPPGITWPTSDNPVVRLNFEAPGRYDLNGGWGRPGGEIMMPLDATHLLYTRVGDRPPPRGSVMAPQIAQMIRTILIENADRLVFDATESDIPAIRPRRIDAAACAAEATAWKQWHSEQSEAEETLLQLR